MDRFERKVTRCEILTIKTLTAYAIRINVKCVIGNYLPWFIPPVFLTVSGISVCRHSETESSIVGKCLLRVVPGWTEPLPLQVWDGCSYLRFLLFPVVVRNLITGVLPSPNNEGLFLKHLLLWWNLVCVVRKHVPNPHIQSLLLDRGIRYRFTLF